MKDIEASVTESPEDRMTQMTLTISTANQQTETAAACPEKIVTLEDSIGEKTESLKDLACDSKTTESVKSIIDPEGMVDSREDLSLLMYLHLQWEKCYVLSSQITLIKNQSSNKQSFKIKSVSYSRRM